MNARPKAGESHTRSIDTARRQIEPEAIDRLNDTLGIVSGRLADVATKLCVVIEKLETQARPVTAQAIDQGPTDASGEAEQQGSVGSARLAMLAQAQTKQAVLRSRGSQRRESHARLGQKLWKMAADAFSAGKAGDQLPAVVYARASVLHLWALSVIHESFKVEVRVVAKWRSPVQNVQDEQLKEGLDGLDFDWVPEWIPDFHIMGTVAELTPLVKHFRAEQVSQKTIREHPFKYPGAKTGEVWIKGDYKFTVELSEDWSLQLFPFDVQAANVRITMEQAPDVKFKLFRKQKFDKEKYKEQTAVDYDQHLCTLPDYELATVSQCAVYRLLKDDDQENIGLRIAFFYDRHETYYVWNSLFLSALITSLGTLVWAVPYTQVGYRLSLDLTLLLVSVAFKQLLASVVPQGISYLTLLDIYVLFSIGFTALASCLHASVATFLGDVNEKLDEQEDSEFTLDFYSCITHLVLWIVFNICFMLRTSQLRKVAHPQLDKDCWETAHSKNRVSVDASSDAFFLKASLWKKTAVTAAQRVEQQASQAVKIAEKQAAQAVSAARALEKEAAPVATIIRHAPHGRAGDL